jgi:hypothetical protein
MGAMKAVQLILEEMKRDIPEFTSVPPNIAFHIATWVYMQDEMQKQYAEAAKDGDTRTT